MSSEQICRNADARTHTYAHKRQSTYTQTLRDIHIQSTHEIHAEGKFGKMFFKIENIPDENNPKTSRLAMLSAIQRLRQICSDDIQIGT